MAWILIVFLILLGGLIAPFGDLLGTKIGKARFNAEWSIVSAKDVGACHKRERIWIIAYPSSVLESGTESSIQAGREATTSSPVTNTHSNGSSTSERLRVNGQTDNTTQKREEEACQLKGGSQPRHSKAIQRSTETEPTNTNCKGLQGQRREHELSEGSREETPCWSPQPHTLDPDWRGYVSQPTLRRGDDGLSNRVLRLKALGNSIVPQVAAIPLARIKQLHTILY